MSVNTSHTPDERGIILFQGEAILIYIKNVHIQFEANPNPVFDRDKLNSSVYLTTHRIIIMNNGRGNVRSFNMPFICMRNVKLEQPIFGANYMKGTAIAQEGGNFQGDVLWKMTFPKGGCIEFGQALLRAVDMASNIRPFNAPPPYTPTPNNYNYTAPPVYTPNNPEFQRAANTFRDPPPNVYVYDSPPPYVGIYPNVNQQTNTSNVPPYPQANNVPPYPAGQTMPTAGVPFYPGNSSNNVNMSNTTIPSAPYEPPPPYDAPPLPQKKKED